jgi:hypothetical protein
MLYQFGLEKSGNPVADIDEVRSALNLMFGAQERNVEEIQAEVGVWQAELPEGFTDEVDKEGYAERNIGEYHINAHAEN